MQKRLFYSPNCQKIIIHYHFRNKIKLVSILFCILLLNILSYSQNNCANYIYWVEQDNSSIFKISPNTDISYFISENKEANEIKLKLIFPEKTDITNITNEILSHTPNSVRATCTNVDSESLEYTFTCQNTQSYEIQKGETGLSIIFKKDHNPNTETHTDINRVIEDIQLLIAKNKPLQDEKLNTLNNTISKLRVENELKLSKQVSPALLLHEPQQAFAQDTDVTGTQSLSVGNVGNPERKIEIREAEAVEEQKPAPAQEQEEPEVKNATEEEQKEETPKQEQKTEEAKPEEESVTPPMPREEAPKQSIDTTAQITRELRQLESAEEDTTNQIVSIEQKEKPSQEIAKTPETKPIEEKSLSAEDVKIKPSPKGLDTITDFQCEEMPLSKLVPLLAYKAGINVIAGTDLKGNVTMSLKQVTLRKAIEAALRMNGLGLLQEENIYRIVPYEDAIAGDRSTTIVRLQNAKATEIKKVLDEISKGTKWSEFITISANDTTNVVIVSGPEEHIQGLAQMAKELDIEKPVIPTQTVTIKLNYADPEELAKSLQKILTPKTGNVSADPRARNIIVTDIPVVIEQVKEIVKDLDMPVKQVLIDTMVVDATLNDEAQTGIDWLLKSVRDQSWRDFVMYGPEGRKIGNLQQLDLAGTATTSDMIGNLTFNILTNEIDWKGVIKAQIQNRNGHLISNPVVATIENKPATITISQEIPYIDLSQTSQGGALTNTRFKQIGTVLEVTPRVTHDNHVIVDIKGKESTIVGEFNGVPIEDLRQVSSTLHINSGQTIFVGGLRKRNDSTTVQKMPILGDIPVLNVVFRTNQRKAQINELLIFLTCSVLEQELPELTPEQKETYDGAKEAPMNANIGKYIGNDIIRPNESSIPPYKWKRVKKEQ
ncbi:MAG: hypothetical protein LDL53_01770 [Candidatus Hydrogenedens sp.]|nr:hypothetical protein [Candidatus Hydrogenedens sp.]